MLRILLEYLVPLLLPTVVYFLVQGWMRRRADSGHPVDLPPWWRQAPWPWLAAAGVMLLVATLAAFALLSGSEPGAVYRPAEMIDGKIAPGGFDGQRR